MLCLFFNKALAKNDIEGHFLIRSTWPQIQNQSLHSFSTYSQLYLHGKFYSNNELKSQVHLIFSDLYGEVSSLTRPIRIYPSVSWLIHEDLELRLGRNTYENKFHQVVSLNSYEPFFYTFDGAFLEYSTDILNANFWIAYLPARWIEFQQIEEFKYGFGLFLDMESLSDYIDFFNFHVAYLVNSFRRQKSADKMSRYGLALEGTISPIDLGYNFVAVGHGKGIQFRLEEKMYHFYISYSRPEFLNSEIFIGYHTDSAQYNPWLYNRHDHAGLLDMFLWGNLTYYFFGVEVSWRDWFDLQVVFHNLNSTDDGPIEMGYFGSSINAKDEKFLLSPEENLGKELDISIQTQLKEGFEVKLLAGLFIPSQKTKDFFKQGNFYNNIQFSGLYKF